jgi:nucleotide-binding universal stress UspA family protein
MYKKIMVPLDGSRRSEAILPFVQSMAATYDAAVILLKVEKPPLLLGYDEVIDFKSYHLTRLRQRQETESYLSRIEATLNEKGIQTKTVVKSGEVVKTIIEITEQENADLIAMASQRYNEIQRPYHFSVATCLLQRIDRPLLITGSDKKAA